MNSIIFLTYTWGKSLLSSPIKGDLSHKFNSFLISPYLKLKNSTQNIKLYLIPLQ